MADAPRIAIVSDPLVQRGGAERVVEALADAFPEAPIFALLYSPHTGPAKLAPRVRTSWLARCRKRRVATARSFRLPQHDRIVRRLGFRRHHLIAPHGGQGRPDARRSSACLLLPYADACAVGASRAGTRHGTGSHTPSGRCAFLAHARVGRGERRARAAVRCQQHDDATSNCSGTSPMMRCVNSCAVHARCFSRSTKISA